MPEDWLDLELSHHLRSVEAPPELWDRVSRAAAVTPPRRRGFRPLPIAAIVTLMLAAGTLWYVARGEQPVRHFATAQDTSTCLLCHTSL